MEAPASAGGEAILDDADIGIHGDCGGDRIGYPSLVELVDAMGTSGAGFAGLGFDSGLAGISG